MLIQYTLSGMKGIISDKSINVLITLLDWKLKW